MAKKTKKPGFEDQLAQLEEIVRRMDAGELPLEEAIDSYEQGMKLSLSLNKTLEEAQRRIEILTRDAQGEMRAEPLAEDDRSHD